MRECIECGALFISAGNRKICSPECARERHLRQQRDHAKAKYQPASPLPQRPCVNCGERFTPYRSTSEFCSDLCRQVAGNQRRVGRYGTGPRACHKCGAEVERKPGKPVCDSCKVDSRTNAAEKEARRRFRKYGITAEQFDALLATQGNRCAICKSANWGVKGPAIDHCHTTGKVRGILCSPCNLALGQFGDSIFVIMEAARYMAEHSPAVGVWPDSPAGLRFPCR